MKKYWLQSVWTWAIKYFLNDIKSAEISFIHDYLGWEEFF